MLMLQKERDSFIHRNASYVFFHFYEGNYTVYEVFLTVFTGPVIFRLSSPLFGIWSPNGISLYVDSVTGCMF